ncbi:hypothetical protein ABZV14_27010 [Streptosporangium canum]|uniref:hypothetical protein n=1 Tax=Streptosporangium canum TaxID=324952 RepID=UPI0033B95AD9
MTNNGKAGRVLVVGLGIAGLATALRLHQIGWEPVVVERAPARRSGGYFIMLFGSGVASARRLGVLEAIGDRSGPHVTSYEVDRAGNRRPGMNPSLMAGGPVRCCAVMWSVACSQRCRTMWRSATAPYPPASPRTTPRPR